MAKLVFGMNQSLDGRVDHTAFETGPELFRHWTDHVARLAGSLYGRRVYELMRYWDADDPAWDADRRAFAQAWRRQPKWVVSRTLTEVGPNATLVRDPEPIARELKANLSGEVAVSGPELAGALTALGLIDEYRLYLHPVAVGAGKPFFTGPTPRLRLIATEPVGDGVVRLSYVPAG